MSSGRGGGGEGAQCLDFGNIVQAQEGKGGGPAGTSIISGGRAFIFIFPSPRRCYFGPQTQKR